ncbi:hypothetical protein E8E95_23675 [Pseudomonas sp. BN414]|uniref:DNA-binding protein n=1 Tax=Pseudomonas sp. BN414 TaxID=2567888 RepID=UPI002454B7D4|nr:DNA-binding protein [Pseudomonas sp. BN414]MDH4569687.1 hypothetical protein [Pseudomonas sp. BN414]
MARGGVNKAVVKIARDALLARGEHPSIDAVRIELGNTGSKSTILRCLHELAAQDAQHPAPTVEGELLRRIGPVADQLREDAQAAVAAERDLLTRQQLEYRTERQYSQERIEELQRSQSELSAQLQQRLQIELSLQEQLRATEVESSRRLEAEHGWQRLSEAQAQQLQSLEEKHQHARQALEHYRQTQKEHREQELRQHDEAMQQLRREHRALQNSLISKQDELTVLNRDNERLLSEARTQLQQHRRELSDQRHQFQEASAALKAEQTHLRSALNTLQTENATLQERLRQRLIEVRQCRRQLRNQERLLQQQSHSPTAPLS